MLEDVPGMISPIIQAMIASHQLQKQGQQQEIEKEKNKQDNLNRQEQLKQAQKALDYEHEHNLAQIAIQQKTAESQRLLAEAEAEANHARTKLAHQQFVHAGGDYRSVLPPDTLEKIAPGLNKAIQNGTAHQFMVQTPDQQSQTPEQNFSPQPNVDFSPMQSSQALGAVPNPYGSADEANAIQAHAKGMAAGAVANAQLGPEKELASQKFGFENILQNARMENEKVLTGLHIKSAEAIAGLSRASQERIANAANATHLMSVGMDPSTSKETSKALVYGALTGQVKLNPANPIQRNAFTVVQQMHARDFDPKDAEVLKQAQTLVPLFDQLKAFAKTLPETKTEAAIQGKVLEAANWAGVPTDKQTDLNNIKAQALNIGRNLEGLTGGRMNNTQLSLDLNALASGGLRKSDALSRLKNLRNLYTNKLENVVMGGLPDFQKEIIRSEYKIKPFPPESDEITQADPDWLKLAPKQNKKGRDLDVENSRLQGHAVYEVK